MTAFLANQAGWRPAFIVPGMVCIALGLWWRRLPAPEAAAKRAAATFPEIAPHLVRRAVVVLLLIAVVSGLVFNAFTLLLPKLIEERLGGDPRPLPLAGLAALAAMLCGAATQFTVGRLIDRTMLRRVFLPISALLVPGLLAVTWAQGWLVLPFASIVAGGDLRSGHRERDDDRALHLACAADPDVFDPRLRRVIGAAAAAPMVAWLHERTGSLATATLVMAALAIVAFLYALAFPDRREEPRPELWGVAAAAAE